VSEMDQTMQTVPADQTPGQTKRALCSAHDVCIVAHSERINRFDHWAEAMHIRVGLVIRTH